MSNKAKPSSGGPGAAAQSRVRASGDARFSHAASDPRFKQLHKKKERVVVDKRFAALVKDKDFASGTTLDKFGRKVNLKSRNIGSKISVADSDEDKEEDEADDDEEEEEEEEEAAAAAAAEDSDSTDIGSTDDSDLESSDDDATQTHGGIAGIAGDVSEVTQTATSRLALVNLEWEQLRAVDILAIVQSFLPPRGALQRVAVYASEFGKQRMAEEARYGPTSLFSTTLSLSTGAATGRAAAAGANVSAAVMSDRVQQRVAAAAAAAAAAKSDEDDDDEEEEEEDSEIDDEAVEREVRAVGGGHSDDESADDAAEEDGEGEGEAEEEDEDEDDSDAGADAGNDEDEDGAGFDQEKLRAYELTKLRYYFAVCTFDSAATALHVYREADGVEFERSANVLDMRFVPEAHAFTEADLRDEAAKLPAGYAPPIFTTTALQQSKVKCTWDREDPRRAKALRRVFTKADFEGNDLDIFMASEEDEEAEGTDVPISDPDASSDSDSDDSDGDGDGKTKKKKTVMLKRRARTSFASILGDVRGQDSAEAARARAKQQMIARANKALAAADSDGEADEESSDNDSDDADESSSEEEGAAEIVFQPALALMADRIAAAASNKDKATQQREAKTAWQTYLDKRKEKKKAGEKRAKQTAAEELRERQEGAIYAKKAKKGMSESASIVAKHNSDSLFDDDAVDYDADDAFFKDAFKDGEYADSAADAASKKGKRGKRGAPEEEAEDADAAKRRAQLELLTDAPGHGDSDGGSDSEEGGRTGYALKTLLKQQRLKKKAEARKVVSNKDRERALIEEAVKAKKAAAAAAEEKAGPRTKRSKPATGAEESGDFKIDVADSRFTAVFDDPAFAIDPAAAAFKATSGAEELLAESLRRRRERTKEQEQALRERKQKLHERSTASSAAAAPGADKASEKAELSSLVAKLKAADPSKRILKK